MENDKNRSQNHRHDGNSPLPLGIDWSPAPKFWDGRNTVWPHDPRMGWSYCIMVPSWTVQPESGATGDGSSKTIVFFRVLVGIQSPEGISTNHVLLRRFSDFLKLFSAVKRAFHRKRIPPAPLKKSFSKVNSSRHLLEERRCALEEWIGKLLSDIDVSRSAPITTFFELEAAVRSFQNISQHELETSISNGEVAKSTLLLNGFISGASDSTGLSMLLCTPSEFGSVNESIMQGNASASDSSTENLVSAYDIHARRKSIHHTRDLSNESIRSDMSSTSGNELSEPSTSDLPGDGYVNIIYSAEARAEAFGTMETQFLNDVLVIHPVDQRHKLNKFLSNIHQRLVTAKTDMEDLIARLNQEIAVKEYLTAKMKDLEMELESTKRKCTEDLQQAILLERERVRQMQWDADELDRKYMLLESKLKFEQEEKTRLDLENARFRCEKELLQQELDSKTEQVTDLQKHQEELEIKSKSDIRLLVKEVKFLRSSQAELTGALNQSLKEKTELERILQKEKQRRRRMNLARKKLISECEALRHRLQESSVNFLAEEEDKFTVTSSSLLDALGLLATSDNRIGLLLAKAQLLGQNDGNNINNMDGIDSRESEFDLTDDSDDGMATEEMRKLLSGSIIDSAVLRKQINSILRCALKTIVKPSKNKSIEAKPKMAALSKFFRR